jgi:hypothetical protein
MKNRFLCLLGTVCASLVLPASAQTPSPDAHPPIVGREPGHVRVLFGGDTCYGESYHEQYAREGGTNIIALKGYDYSVVNLNRLLAAVDFRVLNLETPLTARRDTPYTNKDYIHYSDPVKLPAIFGHYGPIAYSLANNHTLDEGPGGLDDTVAALTAAHAQWFGAGDNLAEATKPMLQKINCGNGSFTLAVFGGFEYGKKYDKQFHFYAGPDKPGTAPVDIPAAKAEIAKLRQQVPDAFVVYFVHREDNYHWKNEAQEAMLHGLREAGVDLVICAGAHMLQEAEWDGRGWIFYGIGNFLFNARGRYAAFHAPPFGMPLVVDFTMKDGKVQTAFRGYPTLSDNQISGYQPRFVTEPELSAIDALLTEKSGWDAAERAAVTRGQDEVGRYLEFSTPKPPAK